LDPRVFGHFGEWSNGYENLKYFTEFEFQLKIFMVFFN